MESTEIMTVIIFTLENRRKNYQNERIFPPKFSKGQSNQDTPPIAEILCVKNGRAIVVCGFLMK